jgi:single-stranded-DNA-specific exonuclease
VITTVLVHSIPVSWQIAPFQEEFCRVVRDQLGFHPILGQILWNRGYRDPLSATNFLKGQLKDLADPFILPGMTQAVERVFRAVLKSERIVVYGDYDVDGVTSTAMLRRFFNELGHREAQVFLPDRFQEGYGLTTAALDRCLKLKPSLMIVVDCGTNSVEQVEKLKSLGIDVIILDHHEPSTPARPLALVNYKLPPARVESLDGAQTEYCSAGLVFKFCHALLKQARLENLPGAANVDLRKYLDLVALATVSDIAPLHAENRILTRHGLQRMPRTQLPGLRALMKISGVPASISTYDCGFRLGPRLNAAGRLESAISALELLLTDCEQEAARIAELLDATNRERQAEEADVLREARVQALEQAANPECRVMVVACRGWHEGVVGIVASRLVRDFHLPAFVLAIHDDGKAKGSGRSIEGFSLARAIDCTREHLLTGGGHEMAAGVSLAGDKIKDWQAALQKFALQEPGLESGRLPKVIRIDQEIPLSEISMNLYQEMQLLEPCGTGNHRPVFVSTGLEVVGEPRRLGAEKKHLKFKVIQNGAQVEAIAFGRGDFPLAQSQRLDVVYELSLNEFQGRRKIELNVLDLRETGKIPQAKR